ncbi:hypothetical protein SOV_28770 [Sporomusa ovata DSM 2662]|nr:hypothetical protein SOV_7c00610 [Sporomusa ovata DSM 2662]
MVIFLTGWRFFVLQQKNKGQESRLTQDSRKTHGDGTVESVIADQFADHCLKVKFERDKGDSEPVPVFC